MISITAYAADGDITITIDKASGSTSRTLWTSTANPGVILSMDGGSIVTDRNDDGGNLVLSTDGATRTVTLTSTDPDYFVSAYTIDAVGVEGDNVTFNAGSTTITTNRTSQTFAVSGIQADGTASFTITPNVAEAKKSNLRQLQSHHFPKRRHTLTSHLHRRLNRIPRRGRRRATLSLQLPDQTA